MNNSVLLATDGSLPALVATMRAMEIARERDMTLIILGVKELVPTERSSDIDVIEYARNMACTMQVKHLYQSTEGSAFSEIIRAAIMMEVQMVVIGVSRSQGLSEFIATGLTDALVKNLPCTVLVVKPAEFEIRAAVDRAIGRSNLKMDNGTAVDQPIK